MKREKKDVLFLCQFFFPEYISSATLPYDTAKALNKNGLSVHVLCGYPKEYVNESKVPLYEKINGIYIRRLRYLQLGRKNFLGRLINYLSFVGVSALHLWELKKYKCVIVYSNPPILPLLAVWAKKLFGTKFIFVAYDVYPEIAIRTGEISESGIMAKIMNFINKRVYASADSVVALGTEMKQFMLKNRRINDDRITVIPNWYEDRKENRIHKRVNRFSEKYKDTFVVSYFGNMGTCQDIDTILGAIRLLKKDRKIRFMFAGHGNKMTLLRKTAEGEKLPNVDIYDFLQGQDFRDALEISNCALVSIHSDITGLCVPSKIYGNMMSGLPIIAIMGDSDIVEDIKINHMGTVINNGDSDMLAGTLRAWAENEQECRGMGENARKVYLRKYTADICTEKYVKLVKKILKQNM